jgi:hypothetical protein
MTLDEIKARSTICGECWEFNTNAKSEHCRRYAQVKLDGKVQLVRRVAWNACHKIPVSGDLKVVPCCGNTYCINPEHQRAMTESQKGKRAGASGAFSSPARGRKIAESRRQTFSKITLEQAQEIRQSEETGPVLAARYGIHKSRVNTIKRGEGWKDYSNPFAQLMGNRA